MWTHRHIFLFHMRAAIRHLRHCDPVLARLIESVGPYRIEFSEPAFDTLVKSIVYQQLTGRVARIMFERLGSALPGGDITPEAILKMRPARMRALGLSRQKTAYIRDLARRTRDGALIFGDLASLSDEQVIERLTAVKGIGVWTAHMFLIFALRRNNVLPTGDFGVRSAIRRLYGLAELPLAREVEAIAQPWHPYCSVAAWYLWRSTELRV